MEHVHYIYNNLPTNQASPKKPQCMMDYTHTGSSVKQEVTLQHSYILRELLIALHMT
jgi:hypothetical protein